MTFEVQKTCFPKKYQGHFHPVACKDTVRKMYSVT